MDKYARSFGPHFEATCIVNTLKCTALGKSVESVTNGVLLRMAVHLMAYVTSENLQDLRKMCKEGGDLSPDDISLLQGLMKFAKPDEEADKASGDQVIKLKFLQLFLSFDVD